MKIANFVVIKDISKNENMANLKSEDVSHVLMKFFVFPEISNSTQTEKPD